MDSLPPAARSLRQKLLRDGVLILDLKVAPRSPSAKIEPAADGKLKLAVKAAPEKGKANDEVCASVAEYLGVPKANVEVIAGRAARQKRVRITR